MNFFKKFSPYIALLTLITGVSLAGLPPTTSKIIGDASDLVTFKYQFPNFTGTHTGATVSLGVNSIAGGGTGASTKAAAFDALSPMSALGDLIYGGAAGTGTALPIGPDGYILGAALGIPAWQPDLASSGTPNTFAGFDAAGKLYTIPGWFNDAVTKGANVTLTADPFAGSVTMNSYYSSFNPTNSSANGLSALSIYGDYDVPNAGFDSNNFDLATFTQVHRGDGNITQMRGLYVNQNAGNGSNTGTITNLRGADIVSGVTPGFTVNDGSDLFVQLNQGGTVTGNYSVISADSNGNSIGGNLTGLNYSNSSNANSIALLGGFNSGNSTQNLYVSNINNSGNAGTDFFGENINNTGTVGGNFFASNISNQSSGAVTGSFNGYNLINQAPIANTVNGYTITNSGAVTKGFNAYNVNNSANVGDGSGISLNAYNVNFNGGSVDGNLAGMNFFNSMPVTGNNNTQIVNANNQGAGYRFGGVQISNNANFSEEIRGFQFGSVGNSRTSTLLDLGTNGTVTNDLNGARINLQGTAQQVTGLSVDVSGVVNSNSAQNTGISINGGSLGVQSPFDTGVISPVPNAFGNNFLGGTFNIAPGFPVAGVFGFGNNLGISVSAGDDMAPDLFLGTSSLGFSVNGFVNQIGVSSGKTVDTINYMAAGGSFPAFSTGGTVTNLSMFRALGVLPGGGALNIDNMYGFKVETTLSGASPTNSWGFWNGDTASHNWLANDLVINGTTGLPSNSSVGLEVQGTTKAIRNPVLTTTQRNALTPLQGMQVWNSTTNQLEEYDGVSWVAPSGSSPLTTKGDLYGYDTVNTRVPVGNDKEVLTADSTQASGLAYKSLNYSVNVNTSSTSIINGTDTTVVFSSLAGTNFGEMPTGFYNTSTGEATIPAGGAGNYSVSAFVEFVSAVYPVNSTFRLAVAVNGTIIQYIYDQELATALSNNYGMGGSMDVANLAVGDVVTITAFQNSGGNVALVNDPFRTHFSMHRTGN